MTAGNVPVTTIPTSVLLRQLWSRMLTSSSIAGLLPGPIAALLIWVLPMGLEPAIHKAFAVLTFMVVSWIVGAVEYGTTALCGAFLFWALGVTTFDVAFSGFTSPVTWFVFGALLIGQAVTRTGLANRLGYLILQLVGFSYGRLLFGFLSLTLILQLLVPSPNAQIVILAPVAIGLVTAFGLGPYSNVATGLFVAMASASGFFSRMFLSGTHAIFARGLIEGQTGEQILWSQWVMAFLPLMPLTLMAYWVTIRWLYPGETLTGSGGKQYLQEAIHNLGAWSRSEKKTLFWLLLGIGLWATDFLHHTHPALIGIGLGLLLALPKIGVLDATAVKAVNFPLILFLAGAISLGKVLIAVDALTPVTQGMMDWMPALLTNPWSGSFLLYWVGFFYQFVASHPFIMLSTGLPVLLDIAAAGDLNPVAVGLAWFFASASRVFIYQAGFFVLAYSYGYFKASALFKVGAVMSVIGGLFTVLLVPLYWPMIGLHWTATPPSRVQTPPLPAKVAPEQTSVAHHTRNGQPEPSPASTPTLAACTTAPSTAQRQVLDPASEAWRVIRDSNDYHDFIAFLETFPDSRFHFAARMRLKQLASQPPPVTDAVVINGWSPSDNGQTSFLTPPPQVHSRTSALQVSRSFSPLLQYMQRRLQTMGIDPGPIDGFYGPRTAAALRLFQTRHGLPMSGVLDGATRQALWAPARE